MSVFRKVSKRDLQVISDLIFDSYITREFEIAGHYFVIRSLTTKEREDISRKFSYLSNKYNIMLILELLSSTLLYLDGYEFDKEKHKNFIFMLNSKVVLKIYEEYNKMEEEIQEVSKFIDHYIQTKDSRNMWTVFKTCSRISDPFSIRQLNQYQYYWIIYNVFKDNLEQEKKSWSKVEFMTNSICAFINPKGFKKANSGSSIVEQLEEKEDSEKKKEVEELEDIEKVEVVQSNDVFSSMQRQQDEDTDQYETRVNALMERTLNGELVDEHDRIVRESEVSFLKKFLREKRIKTLVDRELYARRGIEFEGTVLENEASKIQLEEQKQKGFFHDDFSYLDVVMMKDFAAVSKKEKQQAFDEVMSEQIDIDDEVNNFLKVLSEQNSNDEQNQTQDKHISINEQTDDDSLNKTDSSENKDVLLKNEAQKLSKQEINVKGVDLIKQKQEKTQRAIDALKKRNDNEGENLDIMKFDM